MTTDDVVTRLVNEFLPKFVDRLHKVEAENAKLREDIDAIKAAAAAAKARREKKAAKKEA